MAVVVEGKALKVGQVWVDSYLTRRPTNKVLVLDAGNQYKIYLRDSFLGWKETYRLLRKELNSVMFVYNLGSLSRKK